MKDGIILLMHNILSLQEEKDADLVRRLEKQLVTRSGGKKNKFDLNPLRAAFQAKDKNKGGHLKKDEVSTKVKD